MIFLDTNVIIDLLASVRTPSTIWSHAAYDAAAETDAICCNHVVLAEVAAGAAHPRSLMDDLDRFHIELIGFTDDAAFAAGEAFAAYRRRGGSRSTILPDFLIGGHAAVLGARLLTRDRRLAAYFPNLTLITPETHP